MLIGQYESSIGDKNRVSIPKRFRDAAGSKLIVAKWYEGCLVLISHKRWEALLKRLTGRSKVITSPVRDTDRFILGSAFELKPDSQGRVVLPESLVKYADLGDDVVFLGLGDRVEIWDKNSWIERENYISKNASQMIEELAGREHE